MLTGNITRKDKKSLIIRKCKLCHKPLGNTTFTKCFLCRMKIKQEKNSKRRVKKEIRRQKSTSYLKKQCDILFSKKIRTRDGKCLHCGATEGLQNAHLINRSNLMHRWDEKSAITLCYKCHIIWSHRHPLDFSDWLRETYPGKYQYWKEHKEDMITTPISYNEIIEKLNAV